MDNERVPQDLEQLDRAIGQLEDALRRLHDRDSGFAAQEAPNPILAFPRPCPAQARERFGNAVLLDYLYGIDGHAAHLAACAGDAELQRYAREAPAARALRLRRQLLAREIDQACARHAGQARILCVGAGHLRELDLARNVRPGRLQQLIAVDGNPQHLQVIERCYAWMGVKARPGGLPQLLGGLTELVGFDLIYAADALEQLDDASAAQLLRNLFDRLAIGGRLLLCNFQPGVSGIAYLEGLLDWHPRYRSDAALLDLLRGIPARALGSAGVRHDLGACVGFLEVQRLA